MSLCLVTVIVGEKAPGLHGTGAIVCQYWPQDADAPQRAGYLAGLKGKFSSDWEGLVYGVLAGNQDGSISSGPLVRWDDVSDAASVFVPENLRADFEAVVREVTTKSPEGQALFYLDWNGSLSNPAIPLRPGSMIQEIGAEEFLALCFAGGATENAVYVVKKGR